VSFTTAASFTTTTTTALTPPLYANVNSSPFLKKKKKCPYLIILLPKLFPFIQLNASMKKKFPYHVNLSLINKIALFCN